MHPQMFSDIRAFTALIEPNSTLTLSPGKGVDMQAQDAYVPPSAL
jgi:hypothetical protein